jgi:hypothetical protein
MGRFWHFTASTCGPILPVVRRSAITRLYSYLGGLLPPSINTVPSSNIKPLHMMMVFRKDAHALKYTSVILCMQYMRVFDSNYIIGVTRVTSI